MEDVGLHIDKWESDKMQGRRSIFKVLDYIRVHTGNYDKASWCNWLRTGSHTHLIFRLSSPSNMLEGRSEVDAHNPLIKWAPYKRRVRLSVLRRLFAPTSPVQVGRSYYFVEKPEWNIFPPGILAENSKQAIRQFKTYFSETAGSLVCEVSFIFKIFFGTFFLSSNIQDVFSSSAPWTSPPLNNRRWQRPLRGAVDPERRDRGGERQEDRQLLPWRRRLQQGLWAHWQPSDKVGRLLLKCGIYNSVKSLLLPET